MGLERVSLYPARGLCYDVRMDMRNIARFTYENSSFQGWRLSLRRRGYQFTAYFADAEYGGEEAARLAVLAARERLFAELAAHPDDPKAVLKSFQAK